MKVDEVVFIDSLPKLDLHGFDRNSARVAIDDFIRDSKKMGNELVNIVHGIGSGIIREVCISTLSHSKDVVDFKSPYTNRGCLIVQIKI